MTQDLLKTLYNGAIRSVEDTIMAYAQTNPLTDTITNYLASNNIFRETDEIIGFKTPDGRVWFTHKRQYSEDVGSDLYGKELSTASQLKFDPNTKSIYTEKTAQGGIGGEIIPIREELQLFNPTFEKYGGSAAITGGVFPYHEGDLRSYADFIEERTFAHREALDIAFDYYREKAKSIGTDASGIEWFVANVPRTENILKVLDPTEYDIGLANKYWGVGTAYYLLEPLFGLAKKTLIRADQKTAGKKTIVLDPIINTQLDLAKKIQRASGGAIAPLYPLFLATMPFIKTMENDILNPIYENMDLAFSAFEGVFDPLPPQKKKKQGMVLPEGLIE